MISLLVSLKFEHGVIERPTGNPHFGCEALDEIVAARRFKFPYFRSDDRTASLGCAGDDDYALATGRMSLVMRDDLSKATALEFFVELGQFASDTGISSLPED